jgi:hypothetical protein
LAQRQRIVIRHSGGALAATLLGAALARDHRCAGALRGASAPELATGSAETEATPRPSAQYSPADYQDRATRPSEWEIAGHDDQRCGWRISTRKAAAVLPAAFALFSQA